MSNDHLWNGSAELVRQLSSARGRARYGRYAFEGTRHVERALRAGLPLEPVLVGQGYAAAPTAERERALLTALVAAGYPPLVAPDAVLAELTGGRRLGDIIAVTPIPQPPALATLLATESAALFLAAVDVIEPGNLGALARTAHALGAAAFLLASQSDPFNPKAVRTAMGSLFKLPVLRYATGAALLADLHAHGVRTLGAASQGGVMLPALALPVGPAAVVLGGEYHGLSADQQQMLTQIVTIPMAQGVDSLSVNAAAAVMLYTVANKLRG